jgi:hypothetical protein
MEVTMNEIQSSLSALRLGSPEDKYRALAALQESSPGLSEELRQAVSSLLNDNNFVLAHLAALVLAANGDKSDLTIDVLLQGLVGNYVGWAVSEPDRFEKFQAIKDMPTPTVWRAMICRIWGGPEEVKERDLLTQMWRQCDSLRALSRVGGRPDIVTAVIKTAQSFEHFCLVSGSALYALGAIGSEQGLEFLTYQAKNKGRSEARAALDLFGQATFEEICGSELCPKCGQYSQMQKEKAMFGEKRRCKRCGETHRAKS